MSGSTFPERLGAWLEEGPQLAPPDLLGSVIDGVARTTPSRRVWPWRHRAWVTKLATPGLMRAVALLVVVAVIAVAAALALPRGPRRDVGGPFVMPSVIPVIPSPLPSMLFDPCRPTESQRLRLPRDGFDPIDMRGRIAYRVGREIRAVLPTDPSNVVVVDADLDAEPAMWSTDGTRLLLNGREDAWPNGIGGPVVLRSDGTATLVSDDGLGSFSPDGKTVVYLAPGGGLCYVNADGTSPRLLAFDMAEPLDGGPAWSPDGSVIAYMDFVEDSPVHGHHAYGLSFINVDGSDLHQLAYHFEFETGGGGLAWSPDGSRLVYWRPTTDAPPFDQIFVFDVASLTERQITIAGNSRWPTWSPDGSRIAFVHNGRLSTMTGEGTDLRPVGDVAPEGSIAWNHAR